MYMFTNQIPDIRYQISFKFAENSFYVSLIYGGRHHHHRGLWLVCILGLAKVPCLGAEGSSYIALYFGLVREGRGRFPAPDNCLHCS